MKSPTEVPAAPAVAVIIVAYASSAVLPSCLSALAAQSRPPDSVIVIDNASPDPSYLLDIPVGNGVKVIRNLFNEGFCGANNRGYRMVKDHQYIVFLNPDAFPQPNLIEKALEWMKRPSNDRVGVLSGTLLGFDIHKNRPTGTIDSTGVFQTWYGKWYDRGQGNPWVANTDLNSTEDVPAITGAFMFCRNAALQSVLSTEGDVFDRRFFMYKEDIDISLKLRKRAWRLVYWPAIICYHCRGWQGRERMSTLARYLSARNELRVSLRNGGKGLAYSTLKFLFIPLEDLGIKVSRLLTHRLRRPKP